MFQHIIIRIIIINKLLEEIMKALTQKIVVFNGTTRKIQFLLALDFLSIKHYQFPWFKLKIKQVNSQM